MSTVIQIKQGSVIYQEVDAIVCSANNWLHLGTGNAGEIKEAGGKTIQIECNQIINNNEGKPLEIGKAVITKAGNLTTKEGKRKYIIHAIGLGYKEKRDGNLYNRIPATQNTIFQAVVNALEVASQKGITSIAFPLMCARPGYSTLPEEQAPKLLLQSMIQAIKYFDTRNHGITNVFIVLQNIDLLEYESQD
ncbi:MAG TPA: macro domain-containing protein [Candidatus Saccharimonadales bacterium]|nr:macro domain-containing protein [Candidatus Saccharimonadales bacterium]